MPSAERFHFEAEQWLPYPLERVFAFFGNPENLPRLMPRWQRARIDKASLIPPPQGLGTWPAGTIAGDGTRLTLTVRPFPFSPIRMAWEALIEDFRWNEGFCDVQVRGPFRYWRQCHRMRAAPERETNAPGTLLRDEIAYELPLSNGLARMADRLIVRRQIAAIFRYRHQRTRELLAESERRGWPTA